MSLFAFFLIPFSLKSAKNSFNVRNSALLGEPKQKNFLEQFRKGSVFVDLALVFDVSVDHNNGEAKFFNGILLTQSNSSRESYYRLVIKEVSDNPEIRSNQIDYLFKRSEVSLGWIIQPVSTHGRQLVESFSLFQPLLKEIDYTGFDLLMPFIHWSSYRYEGCVGSRFSLCQVYTMTPPQDSQSLYKEVKMYINNRFATLNKAEFFKNEELCKKVKVDRIKKVGERWFVKNIYIKGYSSNQDIKLTIRKIAFEQQFDPLIFSIESPQKFPDTSTIDYHSMD